MLLNGVPSMYYHLGVDNMHPQADLWIEDLDAQLKPIAESLRALILDAAPGIVEEYKYRVPFYYVAGKPMCYLNVHRKGIDVGFWDGHRMQDDYGVFEDRGKKMIRHLHFTDREQVFAEHVLPLLYQAVDFARKRADG